jgi:16S rRNA (guanine1207-N2)-methyltransferase
MTDHYFARRPSSTRRPIEIEAKLRGRDYRFGSDAGVFSADRVDPATKLLAEMMEIEPADRVLDLGCGYGVLGIVAATLAPKGRVVMLDRNERAVELARENAALNQLDNVEVVLADGPDALADRTLDVVVTNPPVHAGNRAVFAFIDGAHRVLRPGGRFYFVGRKSRGALTFARHTQETFGNAAEIEKKSGYRVYCAQRQEASP